MRDEVEIRIAASGLNFRDVLIALGVYGGVNKDHLPMGSECAGVVTRVGEGVEILAVGDEVVCMGVGLLNAFATVPIHTVLRKPKWLTLEQAASIPTAFTTVLYSLDTIGRLCKGERILIHSAAGGVGLAAMQYAKHVGAEVIATAGSEEKRSHLNKLGVKHVFDSRILSWADDVMRVTGGEGVDVVLNSLAGTALLKGISVLAPFGRFLELGKRDIHENAKLGLFAIRHNVGVTAIAVDELLERRPFQAFELMKRTIGLFSERVFQPLPIHVVSIANANEAFDRMSRGTHIGKLVLAAAGTVVVQEPIACNRLHANRSYLITGGLGGLGLVVAEHLVKHGARNIILLGRGAPSESARKQVAVLESAGVCVQIVQADVAVEGQPTSALKRIRSSMPALGGVVHAAGILDDGIVVNLDESKVARVIAPKVLGGWNLHNATKNEDLDFFVLFSSSAGLLGSAGQAHYAAANAFLDALAHYRRSQNLPAHSINWGPWAEVGLTTQNSDRVGNVARQGMALLSPADGAEIFDRILSSSLCQLMPLPLDVRQWQQANPQNASLPLISDLAVRTNHVKSSAQHPLVGQIRGAPSEAAQKVLLDEYLRTTIAGIVQCSVDVVKSNVPLKQLGFDSLLTVSLKNTLERDLDVRISTANLFSYPTVERLTQFLVPRVARKPQPFYAPEADAQVSPNDDAVIVPGSEQLQRTLELELEELLKRGISV